MMTPQQLIDACRATNQPLASLRAAYTLTHHFVERTTRKGVTPDKAVGAVLKGRKVWFVTPEIVVTKHWHKNVVVVQKGGTLITVYRTRTPMGRDMFRGKECRDTFAFTEE